MSKRRIVITSFIIILFILAILFSFYYYKGKYVVSFETGTDDVILNQYLEKNSKVKKPIAPVKDGYKFIEWQLDGNTYDFDSVVNKNITITAKWQKEEYITIKFESNTEEIEDIKLLKGSIILKSDLPTVSKDGYEFKGWKFNDALYAEQEIYDDATLVAVFEKNKNISIGDYVLIKNNYSNSASSIDANNSAAIGWTRKVLKVYEGSNYPYMLGNDNGVTGFFKEESLEVR